jgi:pyruvate/2-oxoglutarate dehydrogenase complex dihydrolipoamide dehydrogenase (E3) component
MKEFGIETGSPRLDWGAAVERKDRIVKAYRQEKAKALAERGIEWVRDPVRFVDRQTVQADGQRIKARKVIVASGSQPIRPDIPGVGNALDSSGLLNLREIPDQLVVIGGGVIALEFASLFGHVGSAVTVLEAGPSILPDFDDDLRRAIEAAAPGWNVTLRTGASVTSVERRGAGFAVTAESDGRAESFEAERVLLATGRGPRVDGLGLEKIGVRVEGKGIRVNEYLESDALGVYAIGDVHGRFQLSPVADYEGKIAAHNAVSGNSEKVDYRLVTETVFTIPSASTVGLTERQAREGGREVEASVVPFRTLGPAVITDRTEGFFKVVLEKKTHEVLGAQVFGEGSEELIHLAALAIQNRMGRDDLLRTIPIHPSLAEGFFAAVKGVHREMEDS